VDTDSRPRPFFVLALAALLLGVAGDRASSLHARENANGPAANKRRASAVANPSPLTTTAGGDTCSSPTAISALPFNDTGDTSSATDQTVFLNSTCAGGGAITREGPDLIYSFNVYPGNSLTFQVTPAATYDIDIYLLGTCGSGQTCVQESDSGVEGQPETIGPIALDPGTYFLYVDSVYPADDVAGAGSYSLSVTGSLGAPGNAGFFTLPPCRLVDTREAAGPWGGPALVAGAQRTFAVVGRCLLPPSARAIAVNLAVTEATASGNLTLYPGGVPVPLVSAINYRPFQARANNAVVPLSATGTIGVYCNQGSGTTHFILDVSGYFQ